LAVSNIVSGSVAGVLLGGNLSTFIVGLLTRRVTFPADVVLLIEEAHMDVSLISQALSALRQSALWPNVRGILFGRFGRDDGSLSPTEVGWLSEINDLKGAVIGHYPIFGHGHLPNPAFPLGLKCRLDVSAELISLQLED
jgi:muramoyltetrapeptide carboxypeptidase LdcA involved in peptidoglycan recycling